MEVLGYLKFTKAFIQFEAREGGWQLKPANEPIDRGGGGVGRGWEEGLLHTGEPVDHLGALAQHLGEHLGVCRREAQCCRQASQL